MARGGKREGAGRPSGAKNRATIAQKAKLSELARAYVLDALDALADVMMNGESESARVSAATAILDRAYGRPRPAPEEKSALEESLAELMRDIGREGSRAPIVETIPGRL